MPTETTYTSARANFASLCNDVATTRDVVIVKRRGAEDVALVAGMGKPEQLKYVLAGAWSRRHTEEHRIVYLVSESSMDFLQARYHY